MYSSGKITVFLTKHNTYKLTTLCGVCKKELIITSGCVMQTNPQLQVSIQVEKSRIQGVQILTPQIFRHDIIC